MTRSNWWAITCRYRATVDRTVMCRCGAWTGNRWGNTAAADLWIARCRSIVDTATWLFDDCIRWVSYLDWIGQFDCRKVVVWFGVGGRRGSAIWDRRFSNVIAAFVCFHGQWAICCGGIETAVALTGTAFVECNPGIMLRVGLWPIRQRMVDLYGDDFRLLVHLHFGTLLREAAIYKWIGHG